MIMDTNKTLVNHDFQEMSYIFSLKYNEKNIISVMWTNLTDSWAGVNFIDILWVPFEQIL